MFPGGRPPSIFSAKKLNYCVRNGNRCDLLTITTDYFFRQARLRIISTEPITFVINISYDISFAEQVSSEPCRSLLCLD